MVYRAAFLLAVFAAAALTAGCGGKSAPPGVRVGLVTDAGGLGDRSFNDAAYGGLKACRAQLGTDIQVVEPTATTDYADRLTLLATKNFDETVAIGYGMNRDVAAVARRFEKRHFAIIDGVVDMPNVESITFKEEDGAFLAGALAALASKKKSVAFLGGTDVPLTEKSEAGFAAGVREIDPAVKVAVAYAGSFDDAPAGRKAATALYGGGADIVYTVAGRSGLGVIEVAKSRPASYVIGVDSDQDALAPGKILSSVVKRVDNAALRVCENAVMQKPISGHVVLGLAEHGLSLTDFRYTRALVGPAAIAELGRLEAAVAAGTIAPPATREQLRAFKPVRVAGLAGSGPRAADRGTTVTRPHG